MKPAIQAPRITLNPQDLFPSVQTWASSAHSSRLAEEAGKGRVEGMGDGLEYGVGFEGEGLVLGRGLGEDYLSYYPRKDTMNAIVERHRLPDDYLAAAKDVARQGDTGERGTRLPACMSAETVRLINSNVPRFMMWVSLYRKQLRGY